MAFLLAAEPIIAKRAVSWISEIRTQAYHEPIILAPVIFMLRESSETCTMIKHSLEEDL